MSANARQKTRPSEAIGCVKRYIARGVFTAVSKQGI
jgi:hypothetical protein